MPKKPDINSAKKAGKDLPQPVPNKARKKNSYLDPHWQMDSSQKDGNKGEKKLRWRGNLFPLKFGDHRAATCGGVVWHWSSWPAQPRGKSRVAIDHAAHAINRTWPGWQTGIREPFLASRRVVRGRDLRLRGICHRWGNLLFAFGQRPKDRTKRHDKREDEREGERKRDEGHEKCQGDGTIAGFVGRWGNGWWIHDAGFLGLVFGCRWTA
jgi:hypothetical protein